MAKIRFQLLLDAAQLQALRAREHETGVRLAEQVRRAIDAWLTPPAAPRVTRDIRGTTGGTVSLSTRRTR